MKLPCGYPLAASSKISATELNELVKNGGAH